MIIAFTNAICVLHLEQITPVIRALLGDYFLKDHTYHKCEARFWLHPHDMELNWATILPRLVELAQARGLEFPSEQRDNVEFVVKSLAVHLGRHDEPLLNHAISHSLAHQFDLETLYALLINLDDGHRLRSLMCQCRRGFDSPHPLWGGGCAWFISREVSLYGDSYDTIKLATAMSAALRDDDPDAVVSLIAKQASDLVRAIASAELRPLVALRVAQTLLRQVSSETSGS